MRISSISGNAATLGEWSSFLRVLNNKEDVSEPLIKKAESPVSIIHHLEKQLHDEPVRLNDGWYTIQKVKRRPVMPGQLALQFT